MAVKKPIVNYSGDTKEVQSGDYVDPAVLGSGTRDNTKFLRDDGTWQPTSGGSLSAYQTAAINLYMHGEFS